MSVVRGFATYLRTLDPTTEVPPAGLLLRPRRRAVPYMYSDADITALLTQTERLRTRLRTATITTLIGLLAVTGMRIGEVIALDDEDFDTEHGLLIVRAAKLGKWRQIPLHPSTVTALQGYRRRAASPRARRRHRTGSGAPSQASRSDDRHVPHRRRGRRPARQPRSRHPDRTPRPRADFAGHPNRTAGLRADRVDPP